MSIDDQIEIIIQNAKQGKIFFVEDFAKIGSQSAIYTTLHRMTKRGLLSRLAQGIYAKPKLSELLNTVVLPSAEEVAIAIARRDKARLLPSGSYALHALGLSTQIPLKLVFYTDGKARTLKVGNRTIQFRKTTPRKLAMKGEISKLVVQALGEIGNEKIRVEEEKKIIDLLKKEDIKHLKHDIALAPQWMAEIMAKALKK
jgi:predicted transcriptional regulator of viral defense system